ncbi:unnamed protein product, partial [Amoebophrya sp. A25]|eukprot:GSA25T00002984001.1
MPHVSRVDTAAATPGGKLRLSSEWVEEHSMNKNNGDTEFSVTQKRVADWKQEAQAKNQWPWNKRTGILLYHEDHSTGLILDCTFASVDNNGRNCWAMTFNTVEAPGGTDFPDEETVAKDLGLASFELFRMEPLYDFRRISFEDEQKIVEEKEKKRIKSEKAEQEKRHGPTVYYDARGNPWLKTILQPVIQHRESGGECHDRTVAALHWLLRNFQHGKALYKTLSGAAKGAYEEVVTVDETRFPMDPDQSDGSIADAKRSLFYAGDPSSNRKNSNKQLISTQDPQARHNGNVETSFENTCKSDACKKREKDVNGITKALFEKNRSKPDKVLSICDKSERKTATGQQDLLTPLFPWPNKYPNDDVMAFAIAVKRFLKASNEGFLLSLAGSSSKPGGGDAAKQWHGNKLWEEEDFCQFAAHNNPLFVPVSQRVRQTGPIENARAYWRNLPDRESSMFEDAVKLGQFVASEMYRTQRSYRVHKYVPFPKAFEASILVQEGKKPQRVSDYELGGEYDENGALEFWGNPPSTKDLTVPERAERKPRKLSASAAPAGSSSTSATTIGPLL